ncbi:MAG: PHP domain-containing protein [Clostridia bacterium]|nr:PHP domain-containing protein [Clostridia bacterium]
MLIDMHVHSAPMSTCGKLPSDQIIERTKAAGLDGMVLTNHYNRKGMHEGETYEQYARRYISEYEFAKKYGDEHGFRVFFGIEVSMLAYKKAHVVAYGVDYDFVFNNVNMIEYDQEQLYRAVKAAGGVLIQAHPYRKNVDRLMDINYLDGIELSCHPGYDGTHIDELSVIAKQNGKILTCGGDYHGGSIRPHCGMYLPDSFETTQDIAKYLETTDAVKLCVQEVGDTESHDVIFERSK